MLMSTRQRWLKLTRLLLKRTYLALQGLKLNTMQQKMQRSTLWENTWSSKEALRRCWVLYIRTLDLALRT